MRWERPDRWLALGVMALLLAGAAGGGAWWWRDSQRAEVRAALLTGGDPGRGRGLLRHYGCAGCHRIPGVRGAKGRVGSPLDQIAGRVFIAGAAENTAANLIRWIEDPRALGPRTAMPPTGATGQDAHDIAPFSTRFADRPPGRPKSVAVPSAQGRRAGWRVSR